MSKGQTYYDPQVGDSAEMQIRGFQVQIGGTYVLMDDVVTALRGYAQSLPDPEAGALVHDVATWLQQGAEPLPVIEEVVETVEPSGPYGAEADDMDPDVDRIEVYPDPPEDPRPKWYARSIDTGGFIMKTTNGSFDFEWVVRNAEERWPGIPIHLLKNAGEDSMWTENLPTGGIMHTSTRGTFPSVGPPIRRLWAGAGR
jgi:hypothetical protein